MSTTPARMNPGDPETHPLADTPMNLTPVREPPKGTWVRNEGNTVVIGASLRTPFALMWAVAVLVWLSLFALGVAFGLSLVLQTNSPRWPGILVLVFTAILLQGLIWVSTRLALATAGRIEFRVGAENVEVFVGVGRFGRRRTFQRASIRSISFGSFYARSWSAICISADKEVVVGHGLTHSKRDFLIDALQKVLLKPQANAG